MTTEMKANSAGAAFDAIAEEYDALFTNSMIGRAQRAVVWNELDRVFHPGDSILEVNCGTGEDAAHLAQRGVNVVGCDASSRMVEIARAKSLTNRTSGYTTFHTLATEDIRELRRCERFDGAFSNFGGLNCVEEMRDVAGELAQVVHPGAPVVFCVYSKFCAWECLFYGVKLDWRRAVRRSRAREAAHVGGTDFTIYYRGAGEMKSMFAPWFRLHRVEGVGVAVPPSYLERWAAKHPGMFGNLVAADEWIRRIPLLRASGDHILLTFERCSA